MPAKKDTKNSGVTIPLNKVNIVYKSDIDILSRNHDCKGLSNMYIVIKFVDPRRSNTVAILTNLSLFASIGIHDNQIDNFQGSVKK